jgi:rhodanese-related sulfurtransferase
LGEVSEAQIIDVRTPEEFNSKHLDNAVNIDISNNNFDAEIAKLDKSKPVFVYCLSGGRSKTAADKMQKIGFKEIYELDGGMLKWNAAGLSNIKPNATSGMTLADFEKLTKSDSKVVSRF